MASSAVVTAPVWTRELVAELSRRHAPKLEDLELDGARLMYAIAANESSDGANVVTRHEQGYCYGGKYFNREQSKKWGCDAHMSYGPWQVMFPNCGGATPLELRTDPEAIAQVSAAFITRMAGIAKAHAGTGAALSVVLAAFAKVYNGPAVTGKYIMDLMAAYAKGLPSAGPA